MRFSVATIRDSVSRRPVWWGLGAATGVVLVLVVAVTAAGNLGVGATPQLSGSDPTPHASATGASDGYGAPSATPTFTPPPTPVYDGEAWPTEGGDEPPDWSEEGAVRNGKIRCDAYPPDHWVRNRETYWFSQGDYGDEVVHPAHPGDDSYRLVFDAAGDSRRSLGPIVWSPTSSSYAFIVHGSQSSTEMWVGQLDGSARKVSGDYRVDRLSTPRWSDDGTQLGFIAFSGDDQVLLRVNGSAGDATVVAEHRRINGFDFNADGTKMAVGVYTGTSTTWKSFAPNRIDLVTLSTGATEVLSSDGAFPSYSPSGKAIAFLGDVDGDGLLGIWLVDGPGHAPVAVGEERAFSGFLTSYWDRMVPQWSPNGSYIAWAGPGGAHKNDVDVFVARADGSDASRVAADALWAPAWRGDSRGIVVGYSGGLSTVSVPSLNTATARVVGGNKRPLPQGSDVLAWLAPCGSQYVQSSILDWPLTEAADIVMEPGWIDAELPVESPNGKYTVRLMLHSEYGGVALYLSQV